jgi:hypothetical protein
MKDEVRKKVISFEFEWNDKKVVKRERRVKLVMSDPTHQST